jgi:hypothetical protein
MATDLNVALGSVNQRRVLKRLLRDLITFTGTSLADVASKPKPPRQIKHRVLYRRGDSFTDADLFQVIDEIGAKRMLTALDAYTRPQLVAAE